MFTLKEVTNHMSVEDTEYYLNFMGVNADSIELVLGLEDSPTDLLPSCGRRTIEIYMSVWHQFAIWAYNPKTKTYVALVSTNK